MLRSEDQAALDDLGCPVTISEDSGFVLVVIEQYTLPGGLEPAVVSLLLRLPPGFPDAAPDMFWFEPGVRLSGGGGIPGADQVEVHGGREWQRWSRHIGGQWRAGIDNLATYLAYVRRCVDHAAGRAA